MVVDTCTWWRPELILRKSFGIWNSKNWTSWSTNHIWTNAEKLFSIKRTNIFQHNCLHTISNNPQVHEKLRCYIKTLLFIDGLEIKYFSTNSIYFFELKHKSFVYHCDERQLSRAAFLYWRQFLRTVPVLKYQIFHLWILLLTFYWWCNFVHL